MKPGYLVPKLRLNFIPLFIHLTYRNITMTGSEILHKIVHTFQNESPLYHHLAFLSGRITPEF